MQYLNYYRQTWAGHDCLRNVFTKVMPVYRASRTVGCRTIGSLQQYSQFIKTVTTTEDFNK